MAVVRSSQSAILAAVKDAANVRVSDLTSNAVLNGLPNARSASLDVQIAMRGAPDVRAASVLVESAVNDPRNYRNALLVVECLLTVLEPRMSNLVFPALRGLAFEVHKQPIFSSKVAEHVSGKETGTSYYQNPKWEYKLTYDYLPDAPVAVGETDLHTLMGFFLQMRGRGDTFLFQDPDDHVATAALQNTFDGTTAQISLVRSLGGFVEPIGQLNAAPALQIWLALTETGAVPGGGGPYTFTTAHAAAYASTDSVTLNGTPATLAAGAPAAGQYSVAAGVYTFNAADTGKAVAVRYRYLMANPADYTVTMPNVVVFAAAPPAGSAAYATFNYYFVCRFLDDHSDYTKFLDKLWNLSEIGFRSIPQ